MRFTERESGILNFRDPAFSAGYKAVKHSNGAPNHSKDEEWITTPLHEHLMLAALYALDIPNNTNVNLCFALPFQWAKQKAEIIKTHYSKNWFLVNSHSERTFHIHATSDAQGKLAFLNACVDFDRVIIDPKKYDSCIVDPGGETCDILTIQDGLISRNMSTSKKGLGIKRVIDNLISIMSLKEGINLQYHIAEKAIKDGKLEYDAKSYPQIAKFIERELDKLAQDIYSQVTNTSEVHATLQNMFVTGGTGKLLFSRLQRLNQRFQLLDKPFYANALGAVKLAAAYGLKNVVNVGIDVGFAYVKACKLDTDKVIATSFQSVTGNHVDFENEGDSWLQ